MSTPARNSESVAAGPDARTRRRPSSTRARILDIAERLVQERGYNAFSYADVAAELGVTTASLHYHYAGKAELGKALIARYTQRFGQELERIDGQDGDARAKLSAYASLYAQALRGQRMCLCGMLAAEYRTLPKAVRRSVVQFFDDNQAWLTGILEDGRAAGTLSFEGAPHDTAQMIISGLEGAMLVARPYGDPGRFEAATSALLGTLSPQSAASV